MKLSAKFKNRPESAVQNIFNFQLFKLALNLLHSFFFFNTSQKVLFWHANYISGIKNGGHRVQFIRYQKLSQNMGVFARLSCCHNKFLRHKNHRYF